MVSEVQHISSIEVQAAKDQTERVRELSTSPSTVTGMQQVRRVVVSRESSCLGSIAHALLMTQYDDDDDEEEVCSRKHIVVDSVPLHKSRIDTAPLD